MSVNNVSGVQTNAVNAYASTKDQNDSASKVKDKDTKNKDVQNEVGATYEKTKEEDKKPATYSINKMSAEERKTLVSKLQEDAEQRMAKFVDMVSQMIGKQAAASANATSIWRFLADGNYTVDPATKKQAEEDISEDGYWGVKQTSQRLFDFAAALAGDDVEKMKQMQDAMLKGYKQAEKTWGKELPQISKDTLEAANKLFDDYYASKQTVTE